MFNVAEQKKDSKQRFHEEANMVYTYGVDKDQEDKSGLLMENLDHLTEMLEHHEELQLPRLKTLFQYYSGNNESILETERRNPAEEHLADHRATHNFAKYVSQFIQGYMVGIPLKTTYTDNEVVEEVLTDVNRDNDADEHNSDLVLDQSVYGRAYELLYRNVEDETRFKALDVFNTFVIYDDTVEQQPIAGVRYITNKWGEPIKRMFVYTAHEIITLLVEDGELKEENKEPHAFGGIPIIEYQNNKFRQGDFDDVLNLIDLYDASESDTANYMTDLNDAMLVISGNLKIDSDDAQEMKRNNTMLLEMLPDEQGRVVQATADYIYKQYDVAGTEAYKSRVENDIHKFTNTPNLNDEMFAGVQSGEAMKYKLFGLEQVRATKERMFKKSLRNRYRLISNIMSTVSEGDLDVNEIEFTFTPNLPKSVKEEIESFVKLGGQLSQETKLTLLSFLENTQDEMDKINGEDEQFQNMEGYEQAFADIREGVIPEEAPPVVKPEEE